MIKTSLIRNIIFLTVLLFVIAAAATIFASQMIINRRPSFEVASIRPNRSVGVPMPYVQRGDRFTAIGATLKSLIGYAYRVRDWQIQGGPGWINSERWDVEAKAEEKSISAAPKPHDPFTLDVIALMLQMLLDDRFKLRIQRQTKESPVHNLVVAKSGLKIKLDDDQSPPRSEPGTFRLPGGRLPRDTIMMGPNSIEAHAISITNFINRCLLSRSDRPVIDRTNLTGLYSFKMQWSREDSASTGPSSPIAAVDISFGPAFFTALKEQLGLQLESAKGPVEFIVIISVEKPSEN
jgi:uncharacterized protein (TIGR03435 family)